MLHDQHALSSLIDTDKYVKLFIRPCLEFAHCQLGEMGEIKTRANKTRSTVSSQIHVDTDLYILVCDNKEAEPQVLVCLYVVNNSCIWNLVRIFVLFTCTSNLFFSLL